MKINKTVVVEHMKEIGMSQNQLARNIGVSHGALSNALNGRRGAGRTILSGLLKLFPEQTVKSLTVNEN